MGVFVMTTAMTFLTIGSLVFTIIMMKFKADLRFQTVMKNVYRTRVVKPIKDFIANMRVVRLFKRNAKVVIRKRILIHLEDAGQNLHY